MLTACNSDKPRVKSIEILAYYNVPRQFAQYSQIEADGGVMNLLRKKPDGQTCSTISTISRNMLDPILKTLEVAKKGDFIFKKSKPISYCGTKKNVRILFDNGTKLEFMYAAAFDENKKFLIFNRLMNIAAKDSCRGFQSTPKQYADMMQHKKTLERVNAKADSITLAKYEMPFQPKYYYSE